MDGPSGSGKSSTSKGVATRLGLRYLDTGAIHRAGVEVAQSQPGRHTLRRTRLARPGRAVHRHDHACAHRKLLVPARPKMTAEAYRWQVQSRTSSDSFKKSTRSFATVSSTRPTGRPGSWSIRRSSMLLSLIH